jgi:hypothetical protein
MPQKLKKPRTKKVFPEMLPTKKWLTTAEACSYLNLSINKFNETVSKLKLRVSAIGQTRYYMVSQLDNILESNIIVNP